MCFNGLFQSTLNIYYTIRVEDKVLYLHKEVRFYPINIYYFFRFLDLKNKERIDAKIKLQIKQKHKVRESIIKSVVIRRYKNVCNRMFWISKARSLLWITVWYKEELRIKTQVQRVCT